MSETVRDYGTDGSRGLGQPSSAGMERSSSDLHVQEGQAAWVEVVIDMSHTLARIQVSIQELVSAQRELVDLYVKSVAAEQEDIRRVRDMLQSAKQESLTSE